jgi:23S rRNA pseudouridine2604 synthase
MCEYLGYEVTRLQRVRIMNITLEGIPEGKWRDLTAKELQEIEAMVSTSSKVSAAQTPRRRRRR